MNKELESMKMVLGINFNFLRYRKEAVWGPYSRQEMRNIKSRRGKDTYFYLFIYFSKFLLMWLLEQKHNLFFPTQLDYKLGYSEWLFLF